jgi:NAD(P)-dependent dehydrogenase (short-subunit alcohol dehydrogenase family)
MTMSESSKALLITGASTGIGAACALHLDGLGYTVYAGVRRTEDATALTARASPRLQTLLLDVTDATAIAQVRQRLMQDLGQSGLAGLVNNAGIVVAGPLEVVPIAAWRQQLEVNVIGQVAVTQAVLPLLRSGRGRIVNMGSIAGLAATPTLAPYCASKFALEALTDALRLEVQGWGIEVSIIEPGAIATPIWDKSVGQAEGLESSTSSELLQLYGELIDNVKPRVAATAARAIPAAVVVSAVVHALTAPRPKTRYLVGLDARINAFIVKLLPDRWVDRLMTRLLHLPKRP